MIYCLNSNDQKPQNPDGTRFRLSCGSPLLLQPNRAIKPIGEKSFSKTFLPQEAHRLSTGCVVKQFFSQVQETNNVQLAVLFEPKAMRLYRLKNHSQISEQLVYFGLDNLSQFAAGVEQWSQQSSVLASGVVDE